MLEQNEANSPFKNNSVFFIELDKVKENPFQPRKDFNEHALKDLAESIRMYGILQPIVVTRKEIQTEEGGLTTQYELIAGERRTRAARLAGLREIPALIRSQDEDDRVKLELAIIENLQREDLNAVDRARAFKQLADQFKLKHVDIAKKVGKSREYVSNTLRLLTLPEDILQALAEKRISEGHTRPLLMLHDRPEEQKTLFREIMLKKMTVREAEKISRKIAYDKVRKKDRMFDPEIVEMEQLASDTLGTRVHIEPKEKGGKIQIDYFSEDDLKKILAVLNKREDETPQTIEQMSENLSESTPLEIASEDTVEGEDGERMDDSTPEEEISTPNYGGDPEPEQDLVQSNENPSTDAQDKEEDSYSMKDFTI